MSKPKPKRPHQEKPAHANETNVATDRRQDQDAAKAMQEQAPRTPTGDKVEALAVRALAEVREKMKRSTLATADREVAEMQVNRALYQGEYFAPEPYQTETGLTLLKTMAFQAYMVASTVDGVPPRNLDLLRRLISEADTLTKRLASNVQKETNLNPVARQQGGQGSKWPWGIHTTKLLEKLAAAVEEFWTKYDPSKPQTAPTNEKVEVWLKSHGVGAVRVRQIMAQIIRADNAPRGARRTPGGDSE